ncbi:hypothetical protein BDN70DRAFT_998353 [Pholiota conissans]|uniref:CxC2-like cysteine cluster KDZ transposase-associated domain-containing protein n=1 Tax=Pholiota conissans TaxID=109636 RepID=A0A9P5YN90_9AGAR|nr:hypothetical protein BDN70DRAFT_998353 [Pholiota conissans]
MKQLKRRIGKRALAQISTHTVFKVPKDDWPGNDGVLLPPKKRARLEEGVAPVVATAASDAMSNAVIDVGVGPVLNEAGPKVDEQLQQPPAQQPPEKSMDANIPVLSRHAKSKSAMTDDFQAKLPKLQRYVQTQAPEHPALTPSGEPGPCSCGEPGMTQLCHCTDCFQFTPCCATCFVEQHRRTPFHWVEYWNGSSFERKDISALGYVIPFRHRNHDGDKDDVCLQSQPFEFTLVDVTGVHKTRVSYCSCSSQLGTRFDFLLESGVFPASVVHPTTGFTFGVLKDFEMQASSTGAGKMTTPAYIKVLRWRTNRGVAPGDDVPNPYPQFLRVHQLWHGPTKKLE